MLQLSVNPLPSPLIETAGTLCGEGEVSLRTPVTYAAYQWSGGVDTPVLVATSPGTYELAVTDSNGCLGGTVVQLSNEAPVVVYSVQQPDCNTLAGSLVLEELRGGTPPWYLDGQPIEPGQRIPGFAATDHEVTVCNNDDCETRLRFTVFPVDEIDVELALELIVDPGQATPIPITATGNINTIRWSPTTGLSCTDCLQPMVSTFTPTTYEVTLTDEQDCQWTGRINVRVKEASLYIPNAFSPNGDGVNEVFQAYPAALVRRLSVYDRWGAQVFLGDSGMTGWDGRIKGQPAAVGIYLYVLEWQDAEGQIRTAAGEFILLQ